MVDRMEGLKVSAWKYEKSKRLAPLKTGYVVLIMSDVHAVGNVTEVQ